MFCGYTNPENKELKSLVKLLEHIKKNDLPIKVNIVNYYPIKELEEYQKQAQEIWNDSCTSPRKEQE